MRSYQDLLRLVLSTGEPTRTRAVLQSTGDKVGSLSLFGLTWRHDLASGFPLMTTKFVHFKSVVAELLWFLRGETNTKWLEDRGVTIWREWTNERGEVGPIYGKQWRRWGYCGRWGDEGWYEEFDQFSHLVADIKAVKDDPEHPDRRRLLISAWNVGELDEMALPPCHYAALFSVRNGRLCCRVDMRSCDLFLGFPFNVASYGALVHLLCKVCGLTPGDLIMSLGDAHIYDNHREQVVQLLQRQPYPLPRLEVTAQDVDSATIEDFVLTGYQHHPALKGEVAV